MKRKYIAAFLTLLICSVQSFGSLTYTGSLGAVDGGLEGSGFWVNDNGESAWFPASLSWTVTDNQDGTWNYAYNLDVYRADVSHFILEASEGNEIYPAFSEANLLDASYPGTFYEIKTHEASPGVEQQPNPFLPQDIYGPKFDIGDESLPEPDYTSITISFNSDRDPVWGDFYAKCGKTGGPAGTQNTVWNEGLLTDDPLTAPDNGSYLNHVLVPDTIPEPATMGLLVLSGLMLLRRKL